MYFIDREVAKKVASAAFRLDRVYRRRHIVARCGILATSKDGKSMMGIVKAHADGFCDVAFEFTPLKDGSKLRCCGIGRPEVVKLYYPE